MSLSNRLGLLGRKVGMMRIYTDDGDAVPVTVLDVSNNRVSQVKTVENDGYVALQVVFGARKASRVTKPEAGHLAKAGVGVAVFEFVFVGTSEFYRFGLQLVCGVPIALKKDVPWAAVGALLYIEEPWNGRGTKITPGSFFQSVG